jgi:hypothetical protein
MKQSLRSLLGEGAKEYFSTHSKALFNNCASTPVCAEMEGRAVNLVSMIFDTPLQFID